MKYRERLATMPRLTSAQAEAIKDILDRHLSMLVSDHPPVDEAHYLIQQDLDAITKDTP